MNKLFIGLVGFAALAVPCSAIAGSSSYIGAAIGAVDLDGEEDATEVNVGGAFATDISGSWRLQVDGQATQYSFDGSDITFQNLSAHVYTSGSNWAVGGVVKTDDLAGADIWSFGIEGQYLTGPLVLEGEVGVGTVGGFGGDTSTHNAGLNATWYITSNASLGVGYAYRKFGSGLDDADFDSVGIDGEYRFDGSQISVFGSYTAASVESIDIDGWRIGVRLNLDSDTLQARRETGPRWLLDQMTFPPLL
jgi:hypothetical protein